MSIAAQKQRALNANAEDRWTITLVAKYKDERPRLFDATYTAYDHHAPDGQHQHLVSVRSGHGFCMHHRECDATDAVAAHHLKENEG